MSHAYSLRFDVLEGRELMTARVAAAHARPAKVVVPVILNGTLAVNDNASSTNSNPDGTYTTSVPVAGTLGGVGKVRGVWNETVDQFGDVSGLDAIRLYNGQGTIVIGFDNEAPGKPRPAGRGTVFVEDRQNVYAGTAAYAHATETGSIEVVSNAAQTAAKELILHTKGT